jgi:hypothetical protein
MSVEAEADAEIVQRNTGIPAAGQAFPRNHWYVATGSAELGLFGVLDVPERQSACG